MFRLSLKLPTPDLLRDPSQARAPVELAGAASLRAEGARGKVEMERNKDLH
jgi:hypothetical protein